MNDDRVPEKGFYMHHKHDPQGEPHNYMYEVVGIGKHTEDGSLLVIYRSLYRNDWLVPADYNCRPLEMFIGNVVKGGVSIPRFTPITDPKLIAELKEVRDWMYGGHIPAK